MEGREKTRKRLIFHGHCVMSKHKDMSNNEVIRDAGVFSPLVLLRVSDSLSDHVVRSYLAPQEKQELIRSFDGWLSGRSPRLSGMIDDHEPVEGRVIENRLRNGRMPCPKAQEANEGEVRY